MRLLRTTGRFPTALQLQRARTILVFLLAAAAVLPAALALFAAGAGAAAPGAFGIGEAPSTISANAVRGVQPAFCAAPLPGTIARFDFLLANAPDAATLHAAPSVSGTFAAPTPLRV